MSTVFVYNILYLFIVEKTVCLLLFIIFVKIFAHFYSFNLIFLQMPDHQIAFGVPGPSGHLAQ